MGTTISGKKYRTTPMDLKMLLEGGIAQLFTEVITIRPSRKLPSKLSTLGPSRVSLKKECLRDKLKPSKN